MARYPWSVLGISKTSDERAIKSAYAKKLKLTRPEDDPVGFQRLVKARTDALEMARGLAEQRSESAVDTATAGAVSPSLSETIADDIDRSTARRKSSITTEVRAIEEAEAAGPVESNRLRMVADPQYSGGEKNAPDNMVEVLRNFLGPSAIALDHHKAEAALDMLTSASIAETSTAEWPLLIATLEWRQDMRDSASLNLELNVLQQHVVVKLDSLYEWSHNIHRLRQMVGEHASDLTDTLREIRYGEAPRTIRKPQMTTWQRNVGRFVLIMFALQMIHRLIAAVTSD